MHLDDLRDQLRDMADRLPDGARSSPDVHASASRVVRRRRLTRAATGAFALTVAIAVTIGIAIRPSDSSHHGSGLASVPTSVAKRAPATGLTAEQLRAHDGVGVPTGWVPADWADARLWVPNDWVVDTAGLCIGGGISGAGMVGLGVLPQAGCAPGRNFPVPAQAISLAVLTATYVNGLTATYVNGPYRIVHGYRIYNIATTKILGGWHIYRVPALRIEIVGHGSLTDRILATLAPSARIVALAFASQPTPRTYQHVSSDGVALAIPSNWTVATADWLPCGESPGVSELLRIPPGIGAPSCPFLLPTLANTMTDSVEQFLSSSFAPQRTGAPLLVLHHRNTTVTIYGDESGDSNVLDLFAHLTGSTRTHVLRLGLGRNGRIAGGIIASIEATTLRPETR